MMVVALMPLCWGGSSHETSCGDPFPVVGAQARNTDASTATDCVDSLSGTCGAMLPGRRAFPAVPFGVGGETHARMQRCTAGTVRFAEAGCRPRRIVHDGWVRFR